MRKPVNESVVKFVANMLTEDPNLIQEARGNTGTYQDDEVPLGNGVYGDVTYTYELDVDNRRVYPRYPTDMPDKAQIEVGDLVDIQMVAVGPDGNEIQATPEQLQAWKKVAADYFYKNLHSRVLEHEYDRASQGFHGPFKNEEPDDFDERRLRRRY